MSRAVIIVVAACSYFLPFRTLSISVWNKSDNRSAKTPLLDQLLSCKCSLVRPPSTVKYFHVVTVKSQFHLTISDNCRLSSEFVCHVAYLMSATNFLASVFLMSFCLYHNITSYRNNSSC